jgi:hypothetical protein
MKDDRTEEEKYAAWVNAVNVCHSKGWRHASLNPNPWVFVSPSGKAFDLSATNLDKLDLLEKLSKED